jgi:hypothetical protein
MSGFDEREKGFEAGFRRDQELRFKVAARRNRMAALWAAEKMGLTGDAADAYATAVVHLQLGGDQPVIDKLVADLAAKGHTVTPAQVKFELEHFAARAKQQVMAE